MRTVFVIVSLLALLVEGGEVRYGELEARCQQVTDVGPLQGTEFECTEGQWVWERSCKQDGTSCVPQRVFGEGVCAPMRNGYVPASSGPLDPAYSFWCPVEQIYSRTGDRPQYWFYCECNRTAFVPSLAFIDPQVLGTEAKEPNTLMSLWDITFNPRQARLRSERLRNMQLERNITEVNCAVPFLYRAINSSDKYTACRRFLDYGVNDAAERHRAKFFDAFVQRLQQDAGVDLRIDGWCPTELAPDGSMLKGGPCSTELRVLQDRSSPTPAPIMPTSLPSRAPSMPPTYFPSMAPTLPPSTQAPTPLPTKFPTLQPTQSLYQSIQGSVLVGLQDSIVSTRSLVINATAQAHIEKGLRCLLVGLMFDETLKRKMYPNTPPSAIAYDIDLKHRIEDRDGSELVPFVTVDSCVSLKEDGDPANIQVGNGHVKQFSSVCSVTFQLVTNSFLKAFKIVPTMPPTPPPSLPPSPRRLPTFSPTTLELPIQPSTPPSPVAANPISQSPTVSPPNGGDAFLPVSQSPTIQPTRAVSVLNVTHSPTIAPTHAALPTASPTAPPVNAIRVTALDYLRDLFFEKNSTMYTSAVPLVNQSMFLLHPDSIAFTWNWTFVGNYSNLTEVFEALYFDSVTTIPTRENEEFDNDLEKECPFVKELDPEFAAPTSSPTASDTDDVETPGASKTVVSVVIVSVVVFLVAMLAIWCVFDSKRKKRKRHRSVKKSQALLDGVPANDARVHSELIKKKTSASGFRILEPYAAGDISRGHLSRYSTDGSTESVNLTDGIQGLQIDIAQLVLGPVIGGGANGRIFKATYGGSDVAVKELVPNPGQYKKSFQRPLPPHSSSDAYNSGSSSNSVSLPQSSKANGPPRFKPLSTPDRNLTSSSSSSSSGKVGGASTPVAGSTAVKDTVDDSSAVTPIKSLKPDFNISLKLSSDQSSDVGSSVTGSTNSVTPSRRPLKQHISSSNPSVASSTSSAVTSGYHSGTATQFSRSSSTESTPSGELSTLQKGQLLQRGVGVMASSSLAPHKSFRDKNVTDESSSTSEAQGYTGRNMPEWLEHETEDKSINSILNEVKNLRRLRHPNIIQLYGCTQAPSNDTGGWRFLVVMELAACSLLDLILKTPRSQNLAFREFTMDRKLSVAIQIAGGCKYIHDNSMIHFDIKPENILLNVAGNVKICDLGIARFAEGPISRDDGIPHGTPAYMAPEILHENQLLDNKVDVYSYGLVLWQILYGRQPHPRSWTVARLFFEVRKNKYRPPFDPAIKVDLRLIELVKLCWHELPQERPPFHKVISLLDVVILERGLSGKVVNKSVNFKIGDSVGLWDYNQKRYLPATVLDIDSDLSQADVQIKGNGDKHTGVPLVELIQQPMLGESTLASNPLHSITGLAFLHAGQNKHQAWNQPNKSPALGLKTNSSAALPAIAPMSLRFVDLDLGNVASESDGRVSGLSDDPFGSNNMNKTFHFDGNVLELPGFRLTEQGIEGGGSSNLLDELHYESGQLATVEENDLDNAEQDSEGSSFAVQPARQSDGSFGADTASSISCGSSSSSGSPRGKSSALAQVPIRDTLFRFAELGKGVSGTVSAAIHLPSFKLVAVKEVRFTDRGARHQAVRELVALYSKLRRVSGASDKPKPPPPHIVWLYTAYLDPDTQSVCLVMEHCDGGSLQDLLERLKSGGGSPLLTSIADKQQSTGSAKSDAERLWSRLRPHRSSDRSSSDKSRHRGSVDSQERIGGKPLVYSTGLLVEKTLSVIARSILTAIAYLHENRFLHLDIKPANILINSKGEVKLSDFGLAKQLEESGEQFASTFVGTMKYMSPERLRGEQYSYACDIFSFALTMLTVTLGHYPEELISLSKDGTTPNEMLSMSSGTLDSSGIVDAQQGSAVYWKLLERWKSGSPVQLPEQVLHRSMEEPSMLPVTESVTLSREYRDFLAKGLELDPAKRASAKELLNHPWIQMYLCETGFDNAEHISHTAESSRRVLQDIAFGLLGKVRGDNRVRQSFGCLGGQEEETGLALNLSERKLKVLSGELMLPFDVVKQSFIVAAKSNNISCT